MKEVIESVDAIVIGTGAGGAVFAKSLAEKGFSVVILERGGEFSKLEEGESLLDGAIRVFSSTHAFRGTISVRSPFIVVGYGFCVGGSTAINAGTCFRPPSTILKRWREDFGLEMFTDDYVTQLAQKVENFLPVKEVSEDEMGMSGKIFRRGIENLMWSGGPVRRNADGCRGCGGCVAGCPVDAKKATHLSYIPSAVKHGARLYTKAKATKIIIEKGRVRGVEVEVKDEKGRKRRVKMRGEIVGVGAGAVHTPYLLKKSLEKKYTYHVGKHLKIHPGGVVGAIFDEEVKCWRGVPQSYYCDEFLKDEMILLVGAVPPPLGALLIPGFGKRHKDLMERYIGFTDAGVLVCDSGEGEIGYLRGEIPYLKYRLTEQDVEKLKKGLIALARIYFSAGAKCVFFLSYHDFVASTMEEFERGVRKLKRKDIITGSIHPMGTARMGVDPEQSFVNGFLESHFVKGLFVVDASVLPTSTVVNPQETIMILATHSAENIKT